MIVRVLTARVPDGNAYQFNRLLRELLDELRGQPGLAYAKLARRLEPGGEEVILFEEWLTPNDLWRWTGGQLGRPRLLPGTEELVENLVISHYESLDVDPESLELSTIAGAAEADGSGVAAATGWTKGSIEGSSGAETDVDGHLANVGWRRRPTP